MLLLLLFAYIAALGAIFVVGLRSPLRDLPRTLLGAGLLVWAALIVTSHALSLVSALGSTPAFVTTSFGVAALAASGLRMVPLAAPFKPDTFVWTLPPKLTSWLAYALAASFALVLAANVIMVWGLLPANPDSTVYRFPRVYWYFSQDSLMHFSNASEPRPLYYPFNGTLAYLPLLHFQLGPRSFSLPSLVSWATIGAATYLFARDLGGPRIAAAATAWLVCLTPNALIQALSTNDEIIAAAPLLVGLLFVHRWFQARQHQDLLLGTIGVAISAGTKLHVVFYWPAIVLVGVMLLVHHRATLREIGAWMSWRGGAMLAVLALVFFVFSFSFIGYNYASAGRATAWEFGDQILNKPFSVAVAFQQVVLYAAQTVLTPIADLHIALDSTPRAQHYAAFNALLAPLFAWADNGPQFTSAFYRFTGVASPSAVVFNEQTVFIGFTWLVALLAAAWLFTGRDKDRYAWGRVHLLALPVWAMTFAASTRYIEGFSVYLCYATIVSAPALVYAFGPIRRPRADIVRWALLAFVGAAHVFFAAQVVFTSSPRNLIAMMRAPALPASRGFAIDPSVLDEVDRARKGVVSYSISWGQPYWAFMAYRPWIAQFLSGNPNPIPLPPDAAVDAISVALRFSRYTLLPRPGDERLHVYTFPQFPAYGRAVPIRIPDRSGSGVTLIGNIMFALGPEWVFAAGNEVASRHPGQDRYLVLRYDELSNFGHEPDPVIRVSSAVYGLEPGDDFSFRYELAIDGNMIATSDWDKLPSVEFKVARVKPGKGVMTFFVRNDRTGTVHSKSVPLGSTTPLALPSGSNT